MTPRIDLLPGLRPRRAAVLLAAAMIVVGSAPALPAPAPAAAAGAADAPATRVRDAAPNAVPGRADQLNRLGIEYARAGRAATAESLFVAALSIDPKHAGALTNLGNLRALARHSDAALAYYEAAHRTDPADPGVDLNRGAALLQLGRDAEAEAVAADAVSRAGGLAAAEGLLGLPSQEASGRAGQAVNREMLRQLLLRASRRVPAASVVAAADSTARAPAKVASKPAAARAAEASAPTDLALYWRQ